MTFIPAGVGVTWTGHIICRDKLIRKEQRTSATQLQTWHRASSALAPAWLSPSSSVRAQQPPASASPPLRSVVRLLQCQLPAAAWDSALLPGPAAGLRTPQPGIGSCWSGTAARSRVQHPLPCPRLGTHSLTAACAAAWDLVPATRDGHGVRSASWVLCLWWWWSNPRARVSPVLLRGTGCCEHAGSLIPMPTALVPAACPSQRGLRPNGRCTGICFSYVQRYPAPAASYTCSATKAEGVASVPAAHMCAALLGPHASTKHAWHCPGPSLAASVTWTPRHVPEAFPGPAAYALLSANAFGPVQDKRSIYKVPRIADTQILCILAVDVLQVALFPHFDNLTGQINRAYQSRESSITFKSNVSPPLCAEPTSVSAENAGLTPHGNHSTSRCTPQRHHWKETAVVFPWQDNPCLLHLLVTSHTEGVQELHPWCLLKRGEPGEAGRHTPLGVTAETCSTYWKCKYTCRWGSATQIHTALCFANVHFSSFISGLQVFDIRRGKILKSSVLRTLQPLGNISTCLGFSETWVRNKHQADSSSQVLQLAPHSVTLSCSNSSKHEASLVPPEASAPEGLLQVEQSHPDCLTWVSPFDWGGGSREERQTFSTGSGLMP